MADAAASAPSRHGRPIRNATQIARTLAEATWCQVLERPRRGWPLYKAIPTSIGRAKRALSAVSSAENTLRPIAGRARPPASNSAVHSAKV
jgi:hypothetical protein